MCGRERKGSAALDCGYVINMERGKESGFYRARLLEGMEGQIQMSTVDSDGGTNCNWSEKWNRLKNTSYCSIWLARLHEAPN
jgi:hypothetical protein